MTIAMTMFISYATSATGGNRGPVRAAGWSETWYLDGQITEAAKGASRRLMNARAPCLNPGCRTVGFRLSEVNNPAVTYPEGRILPGTLGGIQYPTASALIEFVDTTNAYRKNWYARGIAQESWAGGNLFVGNNFETAFNAFRAALFNDGWKWRAVDKTPPKNPIQAGDSATKTLSLRNAVTFAPNDFVQILRTTEVIGRRRRGWKTKVVSVNPATRQIVVEDFPYTDVKGGTVRLFAYTYPGVSSYYAKRAGTRRVGRPFDLFRGVFRRTR